MKKTIDEIRTELFCGKRIYDIPLRVTYYGRVSTDEDKQLDSLEHQASYFENKIKNCPKWEYIPGYIDEGISGTRADKRPQFLKMVRDAKAGAFDLILTKEVSRFARDIIDCVQTIRDLLKFEVGVLIEDINLNTMEKDSEFRLSIMAIVAQEESRKTSERVKFGYRQTMKQGKRHGAAPPIGYRFRDDNNGYWIDEAKKNIVEYVFSEYAKGEKGMRVLAGDLAKMGYNGETGKPYNPSTLERMIRNPVYKGYIVNGKSYKPSYRDDRKIMKPREDWQLHYDPERVPPLVSEEVWATANSILQNRSSRLDGIDCSSTDAYGNGRYAYSARILCGEHDCAYYRGVSRWQVNGIEKRREVWRCCHYKQYGHKQCESPLLYKDDLDTIMRQMFLMLIPLLQDSCVPLSKALREVLMSKDGVKKGDFEKEKQALDHKKSKLLDGWLNNVINDADYRIGSQKIEEQLRKLEEKIVEREKQKELVDNSMRVAQIMQQAFHNADLESTEILDELVRRFVEKIIVKRINTENDKTKKQKYCLEIWLFQAHDPVTYDLSLCERTHPNRGRRTGPSGASPSSDPAW